MKNFKARFCPNSRYYVSVYVFPTAPEMMTYIKEGGGKTCWSDLDAAFQFLPSSLSLFVGDMTFHEKQFNIRHVMHECLHAVFEYNRRVIHNKFGSYGKKEEQVCSTMEYIFGQVLQKGGLCEKTNLFKEYKRAGHHYGFN